MRTLILIALIMVPALAQAQAQPVKVRAKQHVSDGLAAQDAGRYDEAIAEYQKGYALIPHPEILFNLGQAHRLKGDAPRALAFYRRYLAIEPRGRVARDAERWVRELEKVVNQDDEVDLTEPAESEGDGALPIDEPPIDEPPPARPGRGKRIAGIAVGAAGGVSIAVGIKLGLDARRISDDLAAHDGPWTDALLARQADGRRAETRMFVLTGVGAAALVGGVVLYIAGARATVAPIASDDTAGLAVMGAF